MVEEVVPPYMNPHIYLQIETSSRELMTDMEIDEQIDQYVNELNKLRKHAKQRLKKLKKTK